MINIPKLFNDQKSLYRFLLSTNELSGTKAGLEFFTMLELVSRDIDKRLRTADSDKELRQLQGAARIVNEIIAQISNARESAVEVRALIEQQERRANG